MNQSSSHLRLQPLKEVGDVENRHNPVAALRRQVSSHVYQAKLLQKDMSRKSSQDKFMHNSQTSIASNKAVAEASKNRPQTSFRMATKNTTFQEAPKQGSGGPKKLQINKENMGYLSNSNGSGQVELLSVEAAAVNKAIESVGSLAVPSEIERETMHVNLHYGAEIDEYQRELELEPAFNTANSLKRHKVTPNLRARMIDWMIEVLTNFKCDDQSFFLSVSLLDRYFKLKAEEREISDLHIIGVTAMFIASKYEDIYPLKMKMVFEKIAHKKLPVERIKQLEMDILKTIKYRIPAPTSLDFLKYYLKQVLGIGRTGKTQPSQPEGQPAHESLLIEKMSLYLAKMALHDYDLQGRRPSLQAVGALYVALKICEQLKKTQLINAETV